MKISNEVKVGILAIIAIGLTVWGYFFLKGKNLLAQSKIVYADYVDIGGLKESAPINIQGLQVGVVSSITPVVDKSAPSGVMLRVGLDFNKPFPIPKNSIAEISDAGALGGKVVYIIYDAPCSDEKGNCLEGGDVLQTRSSTFVTAMIDEIGASVNRDSLRAGLDTLLGAFAENKEIAETFDGLQSAVKSIDYAMLQMGNTLKKTSNGLEGTINNLNQLTAALNKNTASIEATLSNLQEVSKQIKDADLSKTTASANKAMDEMTATMGVAQESLTSLKSLTQKLDNGQGSLGKLMNEEDFYNHLDKATYDLDMLLIDIRRNPKRYISLFDKKKNREYQVWEEDPALKKYDTE